MTKKYGSLIFFFCLVASFAAAQIPFFQSYFPLKRNVPLQVNALLQDRKGFMWFGTDQGAFRFDGINYKQFLSTDSLTGNNITALAEDSAGTIWLGHQNGQLAYIEKGQVRRFEPREGSAVGAISDILFDTAGNMWFSTFNDGLYYYVGDRLYRVDEVEGLTDLFIYDLFEDGDGNVWAGTDGGIGICTLKDRKISVKVIDSDEGLPDIIIKKIRSLNGNTVCLATEDAGILKYNLSTHKVEPVLGSWSYGSISDFAIKENQIWISAPRTGLMVYDLQTNRLKVFSQYGEQSLRGLQALAKDREGNIWCGSKTGVIRTLGDAVEHLESLEPCRDINILALAVDQQDRIWFSTSEGLFVRTLQKDGSATVERMLTNTPFRSSNIISLYEDRDGILWAGLYGNGLLRIDPAKNSIRHFDKELRNGNILSITGRDNVIWVGTLGGSSSITATDGNYVVANYSSEDGLSSDFIYQVFVDSRGRTWFGTDGKGVSMMDEAGFHHFTDGLQSKVVYTIAEDQDKNIWVAAQNNGVYRFDGDKFATVADIHLRDNAIQSLVTDTQGNLIAIHNFGLDVFDMKRKRMRYWGEETGIRQKHPNLNAVVKDKYGQLYIGTSKGIIKFSLSNDQAVSIPQPTIEQVKVFDEPIDISRPPQLRYGENNLTFHYVAFWYQNAEDLNYQYKLENYDLEWISSRNQSVTYSRLPPGDYIFKVKVSDTEDFNNVPESTLAFSISPPFWKTSAFYVFTIGFFVISFYGLLKFRERKLMDDKLKLEAKVEERTKEIQLKTEEIQAQNEEIMAQAEEIQGMNENLEMLVKQRTAELENKNKALEEYAFINAHKLRSPVASILGLLNLLSKTDLKGDSRVIREHLQRSAEKLDAVVRSITEAIEKADKKNF
ncbi:MAG TPA: two-component regulator propeller domain-containing protein [Chryseosolibacter sp.]